MSPNRSYSDFYVHMSALFSCSHSIYIGITIPSGYSQFWSSQTSTVELLAIMIFTRRQSSAAHLLMVTIQWCSPTCIFHTHKLYANTIKLLSLFDSHTTTYLNCSHFDILRSALFSCSQFWYSQVSIFHQLTFLISYLQVNIFHWLTFLISYSQMNVCYQLTFFISYSQVSIFHQLTFFISYS